MTHPLDEYVPTPEDIIHIQSKALDEKAQTIHRLEHENEYLRIINVNLRAVCEKLLLSAYFQPDHPKQWACRVCHHWHWKQKDIIHSDWCAIPQAEAAIVKAKGEGV